VNEWLGNDRSKRYLLSRRELQLIGRQRPYLVWGPQQSQKEALLARSKQRLRFHVGTAFLVASLAVLSLAWWYSPWGQIWQVKRELMWLP
jgi:hypothetical protein